MALDAWSLNLNQIGRLIKNGLLSQLEDNSLRPCELVLKEKYLGDLLLENVSELKYL